MESSDIKTAYQLACERIIAPRFTKPPSQSSDKPYRDFVKIAEFENKEDKVLERDNSNETKTLAVLQAEIKKKEDIKAGMESIKIQEPQLINYGDLMEVHWQGNFMDYGGFGRMNRTMVFGLSNKNVRVKLDIEPYLTHVNEATQKQLRAMANTDISDTAPKVYGVTTPTGISHAGKKILYTMIETSERVHKDYAEKLNMMNEIWVATEYGQKIFQRSGVCAPIHVMPLGVDVNRYKPDCGTMSFGNAVRGFKFLSVFRWSYRKGFDVLLKAFMEEFSGDEDVSLVMVSRIVNGPEINGSEVIVSDFKDIRSCVKKTDDQLPHIALYTNPIEEKDMPKAYNSANAFVLISRGEGFGLPYLEAAACGLPVIASNCSGQSDFLKEDNSYLVEPDSYIEAKVGGNMSSMAKLCHFYEGQMFPSFGQNALEKTKAQMRYVFENYKAAQEKAEKLRRLVINKYTWNMAVDKVYNRLREIS